MARRVSAKDDGKVVIEVRTRDGRALWADVREPDGKPVGVAVCAHAMFARRTEFDRPAGGGLARFLCERGWRTIAFDFRGHGDSEPTAGAGASWSYDDLVNLDLPAVVACARARAKRAPVVVVGHSLGGHVALAAQGTGALELDGVLAIAANLWMRGLEPSLVRWVAKRAAMRLVRAVCERRGYFPARALGLGSDDEATRYMMTLVRCVEDGAWRSEAGIDYAATLSSVRVPVCGLTSRGDTWNCPPASSARMMAPLAGPKTFVTVERSDNGGPPPGHMALVTSERAKSAWGKAMGWLEGELLPRRSRPPASLAR